ncbi:MAG: hypothetical protein ABJN95_05880 [Maribacter sp.]|uniref:hypothetical protein n=1 Tax=Maribacter sp. TaxID=1897614 RepID=UPI00329737D5
MKASAKIDSLKSAASKSCIVRNLSRILDLRILDIDLEKKTIHFVYDSLLAFENAKRELLRIGYPISQCNYQVPTNHAKRGKDHTMALPY